jgi:hypothetical protein
MKVRKIADNTIIEIPEEVFQRNKAFFALVEEKTAPAPPVDPPAFDIESCTKAKIIDLIMEKYKNTYTPDELKPLKKDVLIMTYRGELD